MPNRLNVLMTLGLIFLGSACSSVERDRVASIPAQSKARAEQVEAQQMLKQVYGMQQAYYGANMTYGSDLGTIGVALPSNARYHYTLASTGTAWSCQATANLDVDATIDTWIIDGHGVVTCTTDDATS